MINVGIVGGSGYTGGELLRLLAAHPSARLATIISRAEAGTRVSELFPSLRGHLDLEFARPETAALSQCDVVFCRIAVHRPGGGRRGRRFRT